MSHIIQHSGSNNIQCHTTSYNTQGQTTLSVKQHDTTLSVKQHDTTLCKTTSNNTECHTSYNTQGQTTLSVIQHYTTLYVIQHPTTLSVTHHTTLWVITIQSQQRMTYLGQVKQDADRVLYQLHVRQTAVTAEYKTDYGSDSVHFCQALTTFPRQPGRCVCMYQANIIHIVASICVERYSHLCIMLKLNVYRRSRALSVLPIGVRSIFTFVNIDFHMSL